MEQRIYSPKFYSDEELKNKSGIYQIKNLINNKIYIGSSKNILNRKREHFCDLKNNKHHNNQLQRAFNKHNKTAFLFEIIEFVEDKDNLLEVEQYWIDKFYKTSLCYNENPIANKPPAINKRCIYCVELKRKFESIEQASVELNLNAPNIISALKDLGRTCGTYHWVYEEKFKEYSHEQIEEIIKNKKIKNKPIICLDDKKIYFNYKDICKEYNIKRIITVIRCCKNKAKTANKLHFMYLEDYKKATEEELKNKINYIDNKRKIYCSTTNETFNSIKEACDKYNLHSSGVINCCKGLLKQTKNYRFNYVNP